MSAESVVSRRSPLRGFLYIGTAAVGVALGAEQFAEGQGWIDNVVPDTLGDIPTAPALYGASAISVVGGAAGFWYERREALPPVRISVAAIAPKIRIQGSDTQESFGVMSHSDPNTFSAAGGAVRLTPEGRRHLEERYGASNFEREEDMDARFTVPGKHENAVKRFFENPDPRYFDVSPEDMKKELTKGSNAAAEGALTQEDLDRITIRRIDISRQPPAENEEEQRTLHPNRPVSRRVFYRYEIVVPPDVYEKLKKSPGVRIFTPEEVATTGGGVRVGTTADGKKIGSNIY